MKKLHFMKSLLALAVVLSLAFMPSNAKSVSGKSPAENAKRMNSQQNFLDIIQAHSNFSWTANNLAGASIILDGIWKEASVISSGSMPPMNFIALYTNRCTDAIDTQWTVSPTATISYDSGADCINGNKTAARIQFSNSGTYTISARVKNKDGLWTNWASTTITKL